MSFLTVWQFNNHWKLNILAGVVVDYPGHPGNVVADFGVDSRKISIGTADAPGYDALKITITDERPARVALQTNTDQHVRLFVLAEIQSNQNFQQISHYHSSFAFIYLCINYYYCYIYRKLKL